MGMEKPKTQCPQCSSIFRATPEAIGRTVACPGCKTQFTAEIYQPVIESATTPVIHAKLPSPPPPQTQQAPETNQGQLVPPSLEQTIPTLSSKQGNSERAKGGKASVSKKQYPNLYKYIGLSKLFANVFFMLGCIFIVLFAFSVIWSSHQLHLRAEMRGIELSSGLTKDYLFTALATVIFSLLNYVVYIITLAGIDLIRVFLDIERNTRK